MRQSKTLCTIELDVLKKIHENTSRTSGGKKCLLKYEFLSSKIIVSKITDNECSHNTTENRKVIKYFSLFS